MDTFSGLPTHPLLVHAPIVLTPILALCTIAVAMRGEWRRRFALWVIAADVILIGLVLLASHAGEALRNELGLQKAIHDHQGLAETTRNLIALMTLSLILLVALGYWVATQAAPKTGSVVRGVRILLTVFTVLYAGMSVVWMVRTGHAGAKVVWDGVIKP